MAEKGIITSGGLWQGLDESQKYGDDLLNPAGKPTRGIDQMPRFTTADVQAIIAQIKQQQQATTPATTTPATGTDLQTFINNNKGLVYAVIGIAAYMIFKKK